MGVVGVTAVRSKAKKAAGLDTYQGQGPCPSTIALEASRRPRHASRRLGSERDGGSRFNGVEDTNRTLLAAGEERKVWNPLSVDRPFTACERNKGPFEKELFAPHAN